ncbi:SDR family oxidoreductase [Kineosporia sp. NBRC 101731]|uniref:SDR family oxidoreductase n=1 Tax=Kineosporia sp. NBRC 101731 TaxID=3032199 RepID=UPI0024A4C53A|nr:SDR family oxidoreductase [Kineosporia sp. NBRC 101731]GLY28172.1 short-chain dehydrogenase/reductase [Kineosporia sp. NBRC 101731]
MTRTWIITGVSSGFGRGLAERLLARGDRVAGTVRRLDAVADLTAAHPDTFHVTRLDLTDTARIRAVVDAAHERFGRFDVVVSNAGYGLFGAAEEATDEQVRHVIDTNLLGSIQLIRAALPHLRADGGGRIVQLSSVAGQTAYPGGSLYHATKWAVEGFAEALAAEVAGFGIGVTLVEPGGTGTGFVSGAQITPRLAAYGPTPVGGLHDLFESGHVPTTSDTARVVSAIIDSVDVTPAPRRLPLGSDAWTAMTTSLQARLDDLLTQKDLASSTDI